MIKNIQDEEENNMKSTLHLKVSKKNTKENAKTRLVGFKLLVFSDL